MTIAELKEIIALLPDNAEVMICNGHAIFKATNVEIEYTEDTYGWKGIILENPNMPK